MENLTNNEKDILVAIVSNAHEVGDSGVEFILQDVAKKLGKSVRSISATAGNLAKKGMLLCANGESYFDGEVTENGFKEVERINQEVENNKNQDNMENKDFEAPAMDERIVRLNELKSVKLSSISAKKRPMAKQNRVSAAFVIDNWDSEEHLAKFISDEEMKKDCYEIWCIADSRYKQLTYRPEKKAVVKKSRRGRPTGDTKHYVGEIHPSKPWVWTEWAPGKFDWKSIKGKYHKGENINVERNSNVESGNNTTTPKSTKVVEEKPAKAKETMEDSVNKLLQAVSKGNNKKLSKTQEGYLKLLKKGYSVKQEGTTAFLVKDDNSVFCDLTALQSLFKKYGIAL